MEKKKKAIFKRIVHVPERLVKQVGVTFCFKEHMNDT
jgi:hypothetical protein